MNEGLDRRARWLRVLLVALLFAACGQTVWVRPGSTYTDFQRDRYECERDRRMAMPPMRPAPIYPAPSTAEAWARFGQGVGSARFFDDCMMARGWALERR